MHPLPLPDIIPNIILILGDDVGYEIPEVDGGQSYSTPNLDMMAQNGMRFTQCRATPLCSPSRFELLTGKYNSRNYFAWGIMDLTQKTIANILKDAGYKTCVTGKWQLDGGDNSIHTFGFDDYSVWQPYEIMGTSNPTWSRYKDPAVYTDSAFWPKSERAGKYSEDVFMDHFFEFMEKNVNNRFFAYVCMMNKHGPFVPTPDDPEFATWNARTGRSDEKFFPSMAKYMDKKVGELINKVQELGIANRTIIIYTGDNGTDNKITSRYLNEDFQGGKGYTKEAGTHVPLIIDWPGFIKPGSVNNNMIDFIDFLPTLADLAKTHLAPNSFDGMSFYNQLFGGNDSVRNWSYCYFDPYANTLSDPRRWVQDTTYKLYGNGNFINMKLDPNETHPIAISRLTPDEVAIKNNFQHLLDSLPSR